MAAKSFEKLESWRDAMDFVEEIYRLTNGFPSDEKSGMTAALRRGAAAIPAKIADGYGSGDAGEYGKAIKAATGSLREIHTQLALARRLKYISWWRSMGIRKSTDRIMRMLDNEIERISAPDAPAKRETGRHDTEARSSTAVPSQRQSDRAARPMEIEIVARPGQGGIIDRPRRRLLAHLLRRP